MIRTIISVAALGVLLAGCQQESASAAASAGKALFDENCAVCHGPDGNVREAARHDPKTPDLRTIAQRSAGGYLPSVMLAEIIDGRRVVEAHGSRSMPVWGDQFGEDAATVEAKIDSLVAYIESIQIR